MFLIISKLYIKKTSIIVLLEKNGVEPREVPEVYKHILRNCKHLDLIGLMTIGSLDSSLDQSDLNKDFKV